MSRYIDADRLLDALYEHEFTILCPLDEVSNVIDAEPTADVVEVVRCEDCKHYCVDGLEQIFCLKGWGRFGVLKDDDFCSYGERSEDE